MLNSEQLRPILENKYDRNAWYKILRQNFKVDVLRENPPPIVSVAGNEFNATAYELGDFDTTEGHKVGIYEVAVPGVKQIYRNKVGLRNLLKNVYKTDVDAALIVFTQGDKWRFSYVSEVTTRNLNTGQRESTKTDPKRYTYLFGKNEKAKTAADRFANMQHEEAAMGQGITLKGLQDTFNVEKMSKEFFDKYRKHYGAFLSYLIGENEEGKTSGIAAEQFKTIFNADDKKARDFVKKMLGRIVFLYFLEKKGWLGVPEHESWGKGDPDFLRNLFDNSKDQEAFYPFVLEPLFHNTLNQVRDGDFFAIDNNLFNGIEYNKRKIPFLNGGLFEPETYNTDFLIFPAELFKNLFAFFDRYNFTVHEDSPQEHTVAVDPEMLGHIFENLLEDNKDKGAFYTPKEIVHYMCQESLIEYLCTKCKVEPDEELRVGIEGFIKYQEFGGIAEYNEAILQALRDVKICDPAIGSGAFPMGILLEVFHSVETLYYEFDATKRIWDLEDGWNPAKVKLSIIENSIYGVDIEPGAVDIARLRFWLSLVVDETKPQPLPNLDYKIVVGNSLLSKFEDEVIDIDWEVNARTEATKKLQLQIQGNLKKLLAKQKQFFNYKGEKKTIQAEIRRLKIDVLISQLELDKYKYDQTTAKSGNLFEETKKEKVKTTEIALQLAGYNNTLKKLEALKLHPEKPLSFFDWKLDFPEVLNPMLKEKGSLTSTGGFDIVIGNPPYVDIKNLPESSVRIFFNTFQTAQNRINLYSIFIEKSISLLNISGILSFIIPNSILINSSYEKTRRFIGDRLNFIIKLPDAIFENAIVETIILQASNFKRNTTVKGKVYPNAIIPHFEKVDFNIYSTEEWKKDPEFRFNIFKPKAWESILFKIEKFTTRLYQVADFSLGITPYDKYKGHSESLIKSRAFHSDNQIDNDYKPLISGTNIKKYIITDNVEEYIRYGNWLGAPRDERFFTAPRLIVRQIVSGDSLKIYCGYTELPLYFTQIGFSIIAKKDKEYSNILLLAILNSKLINFYHSARFLDPEKKLFQKILIANCKNIPLPDINESLIKNIEALVRSLLKAKEHDLPIEELESKIDGLIFKLYGITYGEIKIIDPQFLLTEKEYTKLAIN